MEYEELLMEEGLSRWESKVYLALLKLGSTTTGPLVEKADVPHSKIYVILDSLIKKGLASYLIKGKVKYFQASSPDMIVSLVKDREKRILEVLPQLKDMQISSQNKQTVELFEGMKAITSFFVDFIENSSKGNEWMGFSAGEDETTQNAQMFFNKIGLLRSEKRLEVKLLANISFKERIKQTYQDRWTWVKKIMRFSPVIFPSLTVIFNNKIIILNFLTSPETAVVISSKELYNFYKIFFLNEWKKAKIFT